MTTPPTTEASPPSPSPRFAVQVSTVLLAMALGSLLVGLPVHWYNERHFDSRRDTFLVLLLFGVFPITAFSGAVSALALLLRQRRWQYLLELLVGIALLVFLSFWESP